MTRQDTEMSTNIRVQRICEYCGNEFTARTTVTRFCCKQCNSRANKARIRSLKIEVSNQSTKQVKNKSVEELKAKPFLSITETSRLIGISRRTIYRMIERGEIQRGKAGRRTIIRRADIEFGIFGNIASPIEKPTPNLLLHKTTTSQVSTSLKETAGVKHKALAMLSNSQDSPDYCSLSEVLEKYTISRRALSELIERNRIQTFRSGKYVYVPKSVIDNILT